ncbi:MAG: hypothetical protein ACTHOF_00980 [Flavisolibacter sp.]|jgi:hypothetical protein
MNKAIIERNIVVVLFVLVLIVFSFAERDTKKLDRLYMKGTESFTTSPKEKGFASTEFEKKPLALRSTRN